MIIIRQAQRRLDGDNDDNRSDDNDDDDVCNDHDGVQVEQNMGFSSRLPY